MINWDLIVSRVSLPIEVGLEVVCPVPPVPARRVRVSVSVRVRVGVGVRARKILPTGNDRTPKRSMSGRLVGSSMLLSKARLNVRVADLPGALPAC